MKLLAIIAPLCSIASIASIAVVACSTPASNDRFVMTPPDRASFPPVAQVFVRTCGTLDCHGTVARNFKIYGDVAMRSNPSDQPSVLVPTTADEIDLTYASLIGLEPETMSAVVAAGGASPERLTFLRKARGTEHHKPGPKIAVGDDRDVCFTTWLSGATDDQACARALTYP